MNKLLLLVLFPGVLQAQLRLSNFFSDGMIIQQQQPVTVWGKGVPGMQVTVTLGSQSGQTNVNADSTWFLQLPAQSASRKQFVMTVVSGEQKVILENILFGDLWICMGQSNMEFPMERELHWSTEKQSAHEPMVRFLNPIPAGKNIYNRPFPDSILTKLNSVSYFHWKGWQVCDAGSASTMSAVAYYFARRIYRETGIPIGVINLGIGGAPLESFISQEVLEAYPEFKAKQKGNWLYNPALPVWVRERGMQNIGDRQHLYDEGNGPAHPFKPSFIYEAGIRPLLRTSIKGILCYQGESNAQELPRVNEYAALSAVMVKDFRLKWNQPTLPFYFVQLSSIDSVRYRSQLWPAFREEQRKMLQLIPYSGMAVSSDLGARDDVHPLNKRDVGERLARLALAGTYHKKRIPSGPLPSGSAYKKGKLILKFKYTGRGLQTKDGGPLTGFSLRDSVQLLANVRHKKVVIKIDHLPSAVSYGWKPFSDGNLINSALLPASTFQLTLSRTQSKK
ncbi:MAG TPA: sialate O-acetylesterase [Chitinophagaceae bacterium]|jgi:sialate O-acetylesterase|nr:sialate O-acetylesterase [Chitinophagaceae bacterium]HRG91307.1 sialate O-acetylesterase [Chitinophagaceae bacterium]